MRHRMHILSGPTDKQGQMPARMNACDGFGRSLLEHGQAPGCPWICHIDQVVRNAPAQLRSRLGSADIHAAVKEPGICRNDLAIQSFRQLNGNLGFANRGWSDYHDQGSLDPG